MCSADRCASVTLCVCSAWTFSLSDGLEANTSILLSQLKYHQPSMDVDSNVPEKQHSLLLDPLTLFPDSRNEQYKQTHTHTHTHSCLATLKSLKRNRVFRAGKKTISPRFRPEYFLTPPPVSHGARHQIFKYCNRGIKSSILSQIIVKLKLPGLVMHTPPT